MPRKTSSIASMRSSSACFNEAAARCRGKRLPQISCCARAFARFKRPRPDAAENGPARHERSERGRASMRPRPDAAENSGDVAGALEGARASMRPRPDAAENLNGQLELLRTMLMLQ